MRLLQAVVLSLLAISMISFVNGYGIRYNLSESLPHRVFISLPVGNPQLGQIVTFNHPASSVNFAKIVTGMPGDRISVKNGAVFVNNIEKGKIIENFRSIEDVIIPEEYYFLIGAHPESFDSRYAEFGLVPGHAIKENLCPIF